MGALEIEFPLLDEGRYGPLPDWRWEMGHYRFRLDLLSESRPAGVRTLQLDPHNFFPMNAGRPLSLADSSRQFIACNPERPRLYRSCRDRVYDPYTPGPGEVVGAVLSADWAIRYLTISFFCGPRRCY